MERQSLLLPLGSPSSDTTHPTAAILRHCLPQAMRKSALHQPIRGAPEQPPANEHPQPGPKGGHNSASGSKMADGNRAEEHQDVWCPQPSLREGGRAHRLLAAPQQCLPCPVSLLPLGSRGLKKKQSLFLAYKLLLAG